MLIAVVAELASARRYSVCRRTAWIDITASNVITTASNAGNAGNVVRNAKIVESVCEIAAKFPGSACLGRMSRFCVRGCVHRQARFCGGHNGYAGSRYRELKFALRSITAKERKGATASALTHSAFGMADDPVIIFGGTICRCSA